jgi:SAM-dependent methyltransferase
MDSPNGDEPSAGVGQEALSAHASALDVMSLAPRYHDWILATILPFIGSRVVEVGCGMGSISSALQDRERLIVIDNDPVCCRRLHTRFDGHDNIRVIEGDILDRHVVEDLAAERLDTVVCVNVLEHIAEDVAALRSMYDILQLGGRMIVFVPALPMLYGSIDTQVGHERRYRRRELRDKVASVGFRVERCRFFNSVGAASWFVAGRIRRQQEIRASDVRLYDRYFVPILSHAERVIPPPIGQSLMIVGRK